MHSPSNSKQTIYEWRSWSLCMFHWLWRQTQWQAVFALFSQHLHELMSLLARVWTASFWNDYIQSYTTMHYYLSQGVVICVCSVILQDYTKSTEEAKLEPTECWCGSKSGHRSLDIFFTFFNIVRFFNIFVDSSQKNSWILMNNNIVQRPKEKSG